MDSKLKCVFVMPENNNSSAPAAGGVTANGDKNSSEKCEKWVDSNKVPSKEVCTNRIEKIVNKLHFRNHHVTCCATVKIDTKMNLKERQRS